MAEAAANTGQISAPRALDMEAISVVAGVGGLTVGAVEVATVLIEGFQACDIVEGQRNLLVEVGDGCLSARRWEVLP